MSNINPFFAYLLVLLVKFQKKKKKKPYLTIRIISISIMEKEKTNPKLYDQQPLVKLTLECAVFYNS